jgi:hypothetical protein
MCPVSEGFQLEESLLEEGFNERHKDREGWGVKGVSGEPGAKCIFWRRLKGKRGVLENIIFWALWEQVQEKTQVACVTTTVQIYSLGQS